MSTYEAKPQRVRPSGWWYALVPLLLVVGAGFAITNGIDEGRRIADSFHGLGDDGKGSIDLDAGDEPTIWAVWGDGRSTDGISRPPARVRIVGPDGDEVEFDPRDSAATTNWSFGAESGVDLGTFTAPTEGRYDVQVTYDAGGVAGPVPTAAVGELDLSDAVGQVVRPILQSLAAAVGLIVLLIILRRRSRRRLQRDASGSAVEAPDATDGRSGPFM